MITFLGWLLALAVFLLVASLCLWIMMIWLRLMAQGIVLLFVGTRALRWAAKGRKKAWGR